MTRRRHGRVYAVALGAIASAALGAVTAANAAEFTTTPGASVFTSGVGPFVWAFQSSEDPNGEMGWTAYKLSTESTWHRCLQVGSASLANLPDGTYTIEIADDLNIDWLNSHGVLDSGFNTCGEAQVAPSGPPTTYTLTIDSTPPTVGTPSVQTGGLTASVSVTASDAGTGVASYSWTFGDGSTETTTAPDTEHTYLETGTYFGSVVVTDGAGNQTQANFTVVIAGSAGPTGNAGSQPRGQSAVPIRLPYPRDAFSPSTHTVANGDLVLNAGIVVRCPEQITACVVRAAIRAPRNTTVLASHDGALLGGRIRTVVVTLPRRVVVELRRRHEHSVIVSVRVSAVGAADASRVRTVTL